LSIAYITDSLSALSVLLPLLASIFFYKLSNQDLRIFTFFIFLSSLSSLIVMVLAMNKINNLLFFHIFTLVEYCFLIFIFSMWVKNSYIKLVLRWSIPVFVLVWLGLIISGVENTNEFPNSMRSISNVILTLVSVYILVQLLEWGEHSILRNYKFWISFGVLISYPATSIIFLLNDMELINYVWTIHPILDIVTNICYACAFFCISPRWNTHRF